MSLIFATTDVTWRSVWIGLGATCLSAGLVDLSAVLERRRQMLPVERLAANRIGRLGQLVFALIDVMFEGYRKEESEGHIESLRALPDGPVDWTTAAAIHPPRSRAQRAVELTEEIRNLQSECIAFAAAGVLGREFEALDQAINSSTAFGIAKVARVAPRQRSSKVLSDSAADLIADLQPHLIRASEIAGPTWKFGTPNF
ncbi:hypothetical protein BJ980_000027 [Nocardioides daedukensis]|uniref:Uncharacterized protein n=1 Tax=Nocardioides daedukensis TaxID=634462 RepID=A0A7Y9UT25_9ACTN|nr:hypothetical protein [Nocardioides daedukensis]NYG57104.1 hypothetical protein [Nocardioides daedukensis]